MSSYQQIREKCLELIHNQSIHELKHIECFNSGKQGNSGIVSVLSNGKRERIVYKISREINNTIQNEIAIYTSLSKLSEICPHFTKYIGNFKINTSKGRNPFKKRHSGQILPTDVILLEYIQGSKLFRHISCLNTSEDILFSSIKQVLMAICIAQKYKRFTHYDLHSMNVILRKCDKSLLFLYILDDDEQFLVPTLGYYPVIIDYGFSYCSDLDDGPLFSTLAHTDYGYTCDRFDEIADARVFLISVLNDMIKSREMTKKIKIFRNVIQNIFGQLEVSWKTGWYHDKIIKSSNEIVYRYLKNIDTRSELFMENPQLMIDILHSVIILPIQKNKMDTLRESYISFVDEWLKIEKVVGKSDTRMYILKIICDNCRTFCAAYMDTETRDCAVIDFKAKVIEDCNKIIKFCLFDDIDFRNLLCSVILLGMSIESIYYKHLEKIRKNRETDIKNLCLTTVSQIFAGIDINIDIEHKIKRNTPVCVIDLKRMSKSMYTLDEEDEQNLNMIHPLLRGTYLQKCIYNMQN